MHLLRFAKPGEELESFVRVYAQREVEPGGLTIRESVPARLEQTLEFQLRERFDVYHGDGRHEIAPPITIVGAYTEGGCTIELKGNVTSFGIFFQPTGLSRLFGVPVNELSARSFEAPDVIGKVICELHARLAELNRFEDRARAAEHFLLPYANRSRAYDPMTIAADHIFRARGVVRIENLTRGYGLGRRQFERRFSASIGLTPKLFARVARFQTALDTKVAFPNRRWLDIAHGLGYHDQMHLIHDFHDLAGAPPEATMASLGDARPPAFANQSQKDRKSHFY